MYGGAPFVNIGMGSKDAIDALFPVDDLQFAVFDLSAFILMFDGENRMYYNRVD